MAGNPQTEFASLGSGFGGDWEDGSGGGIVFQITGPDGYTSFHKVHVLPFGSSSSGVYDSPPASSELNLGQTADNLIALVKALYNTDSFGAVEEAVQIADGGQSVVPYAYSFGAGAAFAAGTASGSRWDTWVTGRLVLKDTFGGKGSLEFPGVSQSVMSRLFRIPFGSISGAFDDLASYITRQTNGPVHAVKTCIVSHAGNPWISTGNLVGSTNKRLRRHFRVS